MIEQLLSIREHPHPQYSNQFYNRLILPCLCFEPNQRPNFKSLVECLRHWNIEKAEYDRLNSLYVEIFLMVIIFIFNI
jgi:hypothetical protein